MMPGVDDARVSCLSVHATYACRHSGACCTAGWSIPVEARLLPLLGDEWIVPGSDGACPQYERSSGLCRVQRDHGEPLMPESCRQFPRRALIDDRGIAVALSHFCPTAASLLLDATEPLTIVRAPAAFPATRRYEGLDATGEWPPLLRPDVLFDPSSFEQWERYLVHTLGSSLDTVASTLERVACAAERLRAWTLQRGSLDAWTTAALEERGETDERASRRYAAYTGADAFHQVIALVPPDVAVAGAPAALARTDAALVDPGWEHLAAPILRYLGAKAFASWTAYQSRGVRTQVAELFLAAAVLRVECARACEARGSVLDRAALFDAVRASDLLLMHLVERDQLMPWLGKVESDVDRDWRR
jgi:hypothetical protein